jgi:hypothetical protein
MSELTDFDPTSLGLPADFVLTNFSKLKGCGPNFSDFPGSTMWVH